MTFIYIAVVLGSMYFFQIVFGVMQIKNFTKAYNPLKKRGRVAIGKVNGAFRAGAIVMFAIDEKGYILEGQTMVGVTIFAKFKPLNNFNGKDIGLLHEENLARLNKPLRRAILNASLNYNTIMSGGEIPRALSPLEKLSNTFSRKKVDKVVSSK